MAELRPGRVAITSSDPDIDLRARLTGRPTAALRRPRYETQDLPGEVGIVKYAGHEPVEQAIPMKFDRAAERESVEARIRLLERLVQRTASNDEPPIVKVRGNGVLHQGFNWRVASIDEDTARTRYLPNGDRMLFACTVNLIQQVDERVLAESLAAFRRRGQGPGIRTRTTKVRQGESSLYDVARRVYRDPSRASDIARANPGRRLGERLKVGWTLRLP